LSDRQRTRPAVGIPDVQPIRRHTNAKGCQVPRPVIATAGSRAAIGIHQHRAARPRQRHLHAAARRTAGAVDRVGAVLANHAAIGAASLHPGGTGAKHEGARIGPCRIGDFGVERTSGIGEVARGGVGQGIGCAGNGGRGSTDIRTCLTAQLYLRSVKDVGAGDGDINSASALGGVGGCCNFNEKRPRCCRTSKRLSDPPIVGVVASAGGSTRDNCLTCISCPRSSDTVVGIYGD